MPNSADFGAKAGQHAQAQGHMMQRNARFIDPWKKAAGQIADARLSGNWGGYNQRAIGPAKPLSPLTTRVLKGISWGAKRGVKGREETRLHTPTEFTPQGIGEEFEAQRNQTQPGERPPHESAEGNLGFEQFQETHRAQFGFDPPPLA